MTGLPERTYRRNLAMLALDYISFGVGMGFLGPTTILPTLIRLLGGSLLAVGSLGAINAGGVLLPQLVAGRQIARRPLVKGYVVWMAVISRACLALGVPAIALLALRAPGLAVAALLLSFAAFNIADGFATVGWLDLLAKAIPVDRRGRAMGALQSGCSLLLIGVGWLVKIILAREGAFPSSYVLLALLAAVFFGLCPLAIFLIQEPRGSTESQGPPPWRQYLPRLLSILRTDARFAWLTVTRWLAGLADMASPFYVLFAADRLHIRPDVIGLFISAGVVGGLLAGALLGPLGDRRGSRLVIAIVMALRCICPLLALLTPLVAGYHPWLGPGIFILIFALSGVVGGAQMVGFTNYLLEIAPAEERSTFVALSNTLGGLVLVAPLLAGWLVEVASYEALFVVTLALAGAGLLAALRRPARLAAEGTAPRAATPVK